MDDLKEYTKINLDKIAGKDINFKLTNSVRIQSISHRQHFIELELHGRFVEYNAEKDELIIKSPRVYEVKEMIM